MVNVVTSKLRTAARTFGIPEGELRSELPERFGIPSFIAPDPVKHWQRVLQRSRRLRANLPPPTGPRIACITTVSKGSNNAGYVAVLAHALRLRGADPFIVYCDGALDGCEHAQSAYLSAQEFIENGPRSLCNGCYHGGERLYRHLDLPVYPLSRFITADVGAEVERFMAALPEREYYRFTYKGMPLGAQVEASVARFFYVNAPDFQPLTIQVARRMVRGAITMAEAMLRMNAELKPDLFLPNYGAYLSRGAAYLAGRSLGKRVAVWARGYVEEAVMLGLNEHTFTELAERTTGPWGSFDFTPERERELDAMLDRRVHGKAMRMHNKTPVLQAEHLYTQLDVNPQQPIVSLFTNCGFDTKLFYDTSLYPDVLSWIYDSIELFKGRPEQLVIRVHPGELWLPQIERAMDRIKDRYPTLPANVRIVPPESKLSSYVLAQVSQVCLAYGSLIGLEVAAMGKPVIVAGRGPYWRKGFTYDVHTRADYERWLSRLDALAAPDPQRIQGARRFTYYFFFLRQIPFHQWNHDVHPGLKLQPWWKVFRSLKDLQSGAEANLDAICDQILHGKEALATW